MKCLQFFIKKGKNNKKVYIFMFILSLLYIITYDIFKLVWGIGYLDLLIWEYCDSFEENEISFNNSFAFAQANVSEGEIIVESDDNVEDDREHTRSSLSFLSKVKIFKDKSKRRLFWSLWERHKKTYGSYNEFKESWNPDINLRVEIKNDISLRAKQVEKDMQDKIEKIRHQKRIIVYFYTRNRRRRS